MTDLEKLALQKDRGYLVRLVVLLIASAVVGVFVFKGLTGGWVGGCMADAFVGGKPQVEPQDEAR